MNIVIQGAGRGIGLALAHRAQAAGATHLFLASRLPEASPGYRALQPGPSVTWLAMDITVPDSIDQAANEILATTPRIDRVISTAGVLLDDRTRPEKRINDLDMDAMLYSYQINALGPVMLCRALWPGLRGEHDVRIASLSARVGSIGDNRLGGWYGYRASKAAQNQLMRTLSIELARHNPAACVATLHPGTVDTDLSRPFQGNVPADKLFTAAYSADCLWDVLDKLRPADTGGFFAYDGTSIPF